MNVIPARNHVPTYDRSKVTKGTTLVLGKSVPN